MDFIRSAEMKITLTPEQAGMLSSKERIKTVIKDHPDDVMAFDVFDGKDMIGFALVRRFEEHEYFLWDYAIDVSYQNRHKGTKALIEFIDYMKIHHNAQRVTTTYVFGNEHAKHVCQLLMTEVTSLQLSGSTSDGCLPPL